MPSITLKHIPEPVYEAVKKRAHVHHRSINGEIIYILEQHTTPIAVPPEEIIQRARGLRRITADSPISEQEIQEAKEFGRR
jgi:plasmid stability protein